MCRLIQPLFCFLFPSTTLHSLPPFSARDQVVQGYIRKADSVLLVSNVRRATNDKTVKDWLSPALRRALLGAGRGGGAGFGSGAQDVSCRRGGDSACGSGCDDGDEGGGGLFGALAFAVTQTDCVVRSEAIENLGLPEATPLLQVAKARNAFVKERLTNDFFHATPMSALPVNRARFGRVRGSSGAQSQPQSFAQCIQQVCVSMFS
jgi:hypothetical protein